MADTSPADDRQARWEAVIAHAHPDARWNATLRRALAAAARTVADEEQRGSHHRAEEAEEVARKAIAQRQELAAERYAWQERGDRAEAAAARVRHLADQIASGAPWLANHEETASRIRAALDTPGPAGHVYLSTGCLHGDQVLPDGRTGHGYCQGDTGHGGSKVPARCKFCAAPCVCPCHREAL